MSADDWRVVAQEDIEMILEPNETLISPDPPSTPIQVTLAAILKAIHSIRDELVTVNERLDKHDKDITQLMQTQHRDTDEYVDPTCLVLALDRNSICPHN